MAARIVYLEIDDEITSAAARIRVAEASRIAVVLPYGSRVATSRINFRLLSRDALTHEKRLSIVSSDPATRSLAASAGLPVFSSVAEYESSGAGAEDEVRSGTGVPVVPAVAASPPADLTTPAAASEPVSDGTLGLVVPAAAVAATSAVPPRGDTVRTAVPRDLGAAHDRTAERTHGSGAPPGRTTAARPVAPGWIRTPWLIGGAILALALLVAGVGVYLLLPSATIVVTPRAEPVAVAPLTVVADTSATQPDPIRGVVPANLKSVPVSASNTFPATGKRTALTKATGTVRFDNLDPTSTNRIAAGSIVRTDSNVQFRMDSSIVVPAADLVGLMIVPAHANVKVTAVVGGTEANVGAGTITNVPGGENGLFLKVTNPEATSGGAKQEFLRIIQADVDGAMAALNLSLQAAFTAAIADPSLTTGGATVFPATGTLGEPTPDVPTDTLVGHEVPTFTLTLSATGTVVAVDAAPVTTIADSQLRAAVKPGHELVEGSEQIKVGDAQVVGQSVSFPVTASAEQIAVLDPAALRAAVLGKPIADAKAILAPYGDVRLTVSPDWSGTVPGFESRVTVTIDHPVRIETPAPTGAAPTLPPPASGSADPAASGSAAP